MKFSQLLICGLLFAAVGAFDYLTGYEVTSYPVYLLPIMLAFFYFGKWAGYVSCLIATVMWTVADIRSGHYFSFEVFRYYNALSRCGIYVLFVYGLSVYSKTVSVHRRRLEAVQRLIPMCHGCGRILGPDGIWRTPEEVLGLASAELPECPDCRDSAKSHPPIESGWR